MDNIEQAAAAAAAPKMATCRHCDGAGGEADYVGLEMTAVEVACSQCSGAGKLPVGIFDPVCARHCHLCEGLDHHWSFDGDMDEGGEPLMGCRHCPALRQFTEDDDENCDY